MNWSLRRSPAISQHYCVNEIQGTQLNKGKRGEESECVGSDNAVLLSTAPEDEPTHWHQKNNLEHERTLNNFADHKGRTCVFSTHFLPRVNHDAGAGPPMQACPQMHRTTDFFGMR